MKARASVLFLPNAFDHTKREHYTLRRRASVRHVVRRHLRHKTGVHTIAGRRIRVFNEPTVCFHNGRKLMRRDWRTTMVRPGDVVTFHTLPAGGGGGGGGGGSNPLPIILAVAIAVAAPYLAAALAPTLGAALGVSLAAGTLGGSLLTAGIGLALGAVAYGITSLFVQPPPPQQSAVSGGYGDTGQISPTYSATPTGNIARLGQPIPAAFGRNQHVPDYVSAPYVRYIDNEEYVYMLLGLGQGQYDIEQLKIGDTPIEAYTDVTWEQIEPNTYPTLAIADTRIITSPDVADVELQDAAAGSPWAGPFAVNPPGTVVDRCEIDRTAPRGLFDGHTGSITGLSVNMTIEAQKIDDVGTAIGSWTTLTSDTKSATDTSPLYWTDTFLFASPGRWQVRMKRTDTMDTSSYAGHRMDWIGLKGRLTTLRRFGGMTCIGLKARITSQLNAKTLQVKALATRKLPTWDASLNDGVGGMTTAVAATRNPCDAYAEIARNTLYGGRIPDSKIDLAGIYALKDTFDELGWTFDYVFDQTITTYEALSRVARSVVAQSVVQGGKLRLVRDVAGDAPVMMFTPDNTRAGSVKIDWAMVDDTTADSLIGNFMNPNSWKQDFLTAAFDDSPQLNPSPITGYGITNRAQMWAVLWNFLRANRYRRRTVTWDTELEGLILQFGDRVSFSSDIPKWGQSGTIVAWNPDTRIATLSQPPDFSAGGTHYIGLRDNLGRLATPLVATGVAGQPYQVHIGAGTVPTIYLGGDTEPTLYQFGPGEAYARRLIVRSVTPRKDNWVTISAIPDDPRMFDELPPLPDATTGAPEDDLTLHVIEDTPTLVLRDFADDNGFVGVPTQMISITINEGVTVGTVVRGTWPVGHPGPTLINLGIIQGAVGAPGGGGAGSTVAGNAGGPGGVGGTALDVLSGPIALDNSAGIIRGGPGGGGGGGGGGGAYYTDNDSIFFAVPGGDGGTGNGGSGHFGGSDGTHVFAGGGGTGGAPGSYGGTGNTGGPGGTGTWDGFLGTGGGYPGGPGGAGGAGGKAIVGYSNITFIGFPGDIIGATSG